MWPVLLTAAGCGSSSLTPKDLERERRAISSLAAETALLDEVERTGHTTRLFAQLHRRYLHEAATDHAKNLARPPGAPGLEPQIRALARLLDSIRVQTR
jgi:hypothetical protein